jgi:SAM-dependent methyltransferase
MHKKDKALIIKRYQNRFIEHGNSITALSSGIKERQSIRFSLLQQIGDLSGMSILDVGCGFADFYQHLISSGCKVKYTGVDIVPEFIKENEKSFPDGNFYCEDIFESKFLVNNKFDYIICSQVFNNKLEFTDNNELVKKVISQLYASANCGLAIDFVTSYVDFKEDRLFYYSPEELFSFAKSLTKKVILRHDYPLFEFCLFIYPDFKGWSEN